MGFLRKSIFVATGGTSGLFVKANSKKARTAKATEKMAREARRQRVSTQRIAAQPLAPLGPDAVLQALAKAQQARAERAAVAAARASFPVSLADELAKLVALKEQGVLSEDEFAVAKARLLNS